MTWIEHHRESEQHASRAQVSAWQGDQASAQRSYQLAAAAEELALRDLDPSKIRTYGITVVSAAALHYKAGARAEAAALAHRHLADEALPEFAAIQLREVVEAIWEAADRVERGGPASHRLEFSVKGGEVLNGAAPLDVIQGITQRTETLLHRAAERTHALPHRRRGRASKAITDAYRPWLIQAEPRSYRFDVALHEPAEPSMFANIQPRPDDVIDLSASVLAAGVFSPHTKLPQLVDDPSYRKTFLELARDLSPTGRRHTSVEIDSESLDHRVTLNPDTRAFLTDTLRAYAMPENSDDTQEITGILRGVQLDNDWLDVVVDGTGTKVYGVRESVDDLIGPMMNRPVIVTVTRSDSASPRFVDIELDE